jgi:hypothetical protein
MDLGVADPVRVRTGTAQDLGHGRQISSESVSGGGLPSHRGVRIVSSIFT